MLFKSFSATLKTGEVKEAEVWVSLLFFLHKNIPSYNICDYAVFFSSLFFNPANRFFRTTAVLH